MLTLPILAYLACLWALRRRDVTHALAVNWAVNQAVVMLNGGLPHLPFFILADFLTGLWLAMKLQGTVARQTAFFFLPMIAMNAAAYAAGTLPNWHHTALFGLAWLQLLWVVIGVKKHELVGSLDNPFGGLRNAASWANSHFRGRK